MQGQASEKKRKLPAGIRQRHSRSCPGGKCDCPVEASVYDARESREQGRIVKIRKTFTGPGALAAAKNWRRDAGSLVASGQIKQEKRQRLGDAIAEWLEKCEKGERLSPRTHRPYAPSTLRDYRSDLSRFVLSEIGHLYLGDVTRGHVERVIEKMNGEGYSGQTVRNAIVPLQAFYRYKKLPFDPTANLDLPEPGRARDRAETPAGAVALLEALEGDTRDIYAAAFYSGLRRGELQALRVEDVLEDRLRVRRSWDQVDGDKEPKSRAGLRDVPILSLLRPILERRCEGRAADAFVFGTDGAPFSPNTLRDNAIKQWGATDLEPITLHECRHSYITWLDACVSEARADRYAGHANTSVQRRYRHLLPGQLAEDAALLEDYLAGSIAGKVVTLAS
jgi:integrase